MNSDRKIVMSKVYSPKMNLEIPESLNHTTDVNNMGHYSNFMNTGEHLSINNRDYFYA